MMIIVVTLMILVVILMMMLGSSAMVRWFSDKRQARADGQTLRGRGGGAVGQGWGAREGQQGRLRGGAHSDSSLAARWGKATIFKF